MGMTIDEIIAKEKEIADEFQNTVDTHMVNSGCSLEEMCCDDTEVIEENLKRCKELSDYHNQIADTMHKYQQIKEIVGNYGFDTSWLCLKKIRKVLEDGND